MGKEDPVEVCYLNFKNALDSASHVLLFILGPLKLATSVARWTEEYLQDR